MLRFPQRTQTSHVQMNLWLRTSLSGQQAGLKILLLLLLQRKPHRTLLENRRLECVCGTCSKHTHTHTTEEARGRENRPREEGGDIKELVLR